MTPKQVRELREAARKFFNATVANGPTTIIRSRTMRACDRVNRAAERLEKILIETKETT